MLKEKPAFMCQLHPSHLSRGGDLLLPVLLHMKLGGSAHAAHAAHGGVAGFSHVVALLPGRQDLCRGGYLQKDGAVVKSEAALESTRHVELNMHAPRSVVSQLMGDLLTPVSLGYSSGWTGRPHLFAGHDGRLDRSDGRDGQSGGGRNSSADDRDATQR